MPAEQWTKIATTTRRSLPALLFACGILGLLGFEALRSYRAVQRDAERNVENLVQVLSAQTERTIEAVCTAVRKPSSGAPAFVPARAA